jgi:hypothetical protein
MRIMSLHAALPLLLLPVLQAQNPPAPATITPRLDSPQARVIVATLQPRTPSIARTGHATDRCGLSRRWRDDLQGRRTIDTSNFTGKG